MKTLHLLIIFGAVIILPVSSSPSISNSSKVQEILSPGLTPYLADHGYAMVPSNTTEWFLWWNHYNDISNYSDIIFTGDIMSIKVLNVTSFYTVGNITQTFSSMEATQYITGPPYEKINYTLNLDQYAVHVDEFLKNPQSSNNMTIREPIIDPTWHSDPPGPRFNVGDHVLFYVKNLDGSNVYSQNSFIIPNVCNATDVLGQNRYAGSDFTMTQNGVQTDYGKSGNIPPFTANMPIQFMYSTRVDTLSGKDFVIKYDILDDPSNRIISSNKINISSKKCEWMESAKWEASLKSGNYYANIYVKNTDGTFRQTYSVGFSVKPNMTNTSSLSSDQNSDQIPTYTKSPEFSFAVPVMLIGIVSVITFYRMKFRK
ncbi:MAG: hypothetical protein KGI05_01770 [Thaumarchaeota archaeon]|nr:hypothetical protein [Nitrososphaerota archaeon]